jgi:hypothetical protein
MAGEIVTITIDDASGNFEILVKNTREDLLHDFQYFLSEARKNDPNVPESMFHHARFLRAALLILFAYAEAVVNGWLHTLLEQREVGFLFGRIQRDCMDKKIELLNELSLATVTRPNVKDAKEVRNLFVHFTPTREDEAFSRLSLSVVESSANDLFRWMTEMESTLNLKSHAKSDELMRAFAESGTTTKEVSTDLAQ